MKHKGRYGPYGGFYVPEVLIPALEEIEAAFERFKNDPEFYEELGALYADYAGRPTPLYYARRFSETVGFAVYIKREDLLHGGAHKINNTLGQGLLARYMGKTKLIAETGAGQHGLATAIVGALFGMQTKVFMGCTDVQRQNVNVHKMRLMGAEVIPVEGGTGTLKDAINDALRYWTAHVSDTFYSAPPAARTPTLLLCGIFRNPSAEKPAGNAWTRSAVFRIWLLPAWAAVPTPSASSPAFWTIRRFS